jgi:hypothetical protein
MTAKTLVEAAFIVRNSTAGLNLNGRAGNALAPASQKVADQLSQFRRRLEQSGVLA